MNRKSRLTFAVLALVALGLLAAWLLWPEPAPRPLVQAPTTTAPAQTSASARQSAPAAAPAGPVPSAKPASTPGEAGGFGGAPEEPPPPNLLEQIAAVHGMVSQAQISEYLQKNAELAAKSVERYCEEAKKLAPPRLNESRRLKDASAYLVDRVDWEGGKTGSMHLPDALTERLSKAGKNWPEALTEADYAGLDFSWLHDLQGFDTWNVAEVGPLHDYAGTKLYDAPLPNYVNFLRWLKLRFAKALRTGDLVQASAEARHVADLMHSQGVLIADMVAIAVLRIEREAYDAAARQGRTVAGWSPPPTYEDLDALRRLSRPAANFFFPGVDPKVMERALECTPMPCSALTEAAFTHVAVGEFAPTPNTGQFWAMAAKQSCESGIRAKIRTGKPLTPTDANSLFSSEPQTLEKYFPPPATPAKQ